MDFPAPRWLIRTVSLEPLRTRLWMGWNVVLCFLFVAAQLDLRQPPPESHPWPILCNRRILKVSTILTFQILELPNTYHSYHKQKSLNRSCFWSSIPTAYLWGKIHHHHIPSSKPTISLSSETISCSDFFFGCNKKWPLHKNPRENHDKTACLFFHWFFGYSNQNQKKLSAEVQWKKITGQEPEGIWNFLFCLTCLGILNSLW